MDATAPSLEQRIIERIRSQGPITFAAYMELALYDPVAGFFNGSVFGERGHFVTSPHVSPAFGVLLSRELRAMWETLERPAPFDVVELGAGDGTLAKQILGAARELPAFADAFRYRAVEIGEASRATLTAAGLEVARSLEECASLAGCVIANELLDNVPFHRVRRSGDRWVEVLVGTDGDRLVEAEGSVEHLEFVPPDRDDVIEITVAPRSARVAADVARALERGYAIFVDYGYTRSEMPEPVRGYRANRMTTDVLSTPGEMDVTGPVDFDAFVRAGRDAGLQAWGPRTQRDALMSIGYRALLDEVRAQQAVAEAADDWRSALRAHEARTKAAMVVDPTGLGAHKVVVLGTADVPQPRMMRDGS